MEQPPGRRSVASGKTASNVSGCIDGAQKCASFAGRSARAGHVAGVTDHSFAVDGGPGYLVRRSKMQAFLLTLHDTFVAVKSEENPYNHTATQRLNSS